MKKHSAQQVFEALDQREISIFGELTKTRTDVETSRLGNKFTDICASEGIK